MTSHDTTAAAPKLVAVTKLPFRTEPFGGIGWSVLESTPTEIAAFFRSHPHAAMPCWRRMEIGSDGVLYTVR